jgi:hypothetical protein
MRSATMAEIESYEMTVMGCWARDRVIGVRWPVRRPGEPEPGPVPGTPCYCPLCGESEWEDLTGTVPAHECDVVDLADLKFAEW